LGLTEGEVDQVRAETVASLRTMLAAQISLGDHDFRLINQ